jgi:uncharacterized 2Fe-2S/4Fe-4S cluster protein (DUF4445 family)
MSHKLCIALQPSPFYITVSEGQNIRDALDLTAFRVRSGCRGIGACGLCKIKIIEGNATPPTEAERLHLSEIELLEGIRMACQTHCRSTMVIEIVNAAAQSIWRSLPLEYWYRDNLDETAHNSQKEGYGIAIDLGTTNISIALFSYRSRSVIAIRTGPNPQSKFGSDVISRIDAALESQADAKALETLALEAIRDGLLDISVREGIALERANRLIIVGNTAMLSLLCNCNQHLLNDPSQWEKPIEVIPTKYDEWIKLWSIAPDAKVEVMAPIAGFIGSDLRAGIIATNMMSLEVPSLLIDVGTNTEMALCVNKEIWTTSTSGGPAFEGMGISHGMPAMEGAIYQADFNPENEKWHFHSVGEKNVSGICGSGLVSLIAVLREQGILNSHGNFSSGKYEWQLPLKESSLIITKNDIDMIQRAKAAIAAGVRVLCDKAGLMPSEIDQLFIGGAFGWFIDVEKAKAIGLLPPAKNVHLVGNSALSGVIQALQSDDVSGKLGDIGNSLHIINLSNAADFDELFLNNLYLKPMDSF